ncbi:alpha-ketoglutarate-dependent taurine dioxygenase [Streptomyces sp. 1114.5]|uniref:TauD/TfdA family dioxygenase n=1 Tax=unclassified Streptomyces TaxID=2593676 RepID=UPI000BCCC418|nr:MULTISPECIES: TauD/TfdA family dioxygenase [unclassified Streptomyces]RKT17067.1 alpha-ketoglutarate-dependent taurine dioxygenase [Streptomyces sp. 1114.5]SOB83278.1 Taurine dioxygenase, alpha-ketoglutarate-dependent [Streptomyces sp. 1331.2]
MTVFDVTVAAGRPPVARLDGPVGALAGHRPAVDALVAEHGAVLLRGLSLPDAAAVQEAVRALTDEQMDEREPFAPRTAHLPGLYSSTEWPSDQPMCMHHELSYALRAPSRQVFGCLTAPAAGGAVALADGAAVLRDLPAELVERFERHGWELRRTHGGPVGVTWQEAFATTDRAEVERYCEENGVEFAWDADGRLRTRRVRPAVLRHPGTGERVWFNQIAFLNEWTMDPVVREYLLFECGPDGLPFNTRCGDGTPLDRATVDLINEVYEAHTVREPWQDGDLLVVDNLRMAHSRDPYQGERRIAVALADPVAVSRN